MKYGSQIKKHYEETKALLAVWLGRGFRRKGWSDFHNQESNRVFGHAKSHTCETAPSKFVVDSVKEEVNVFKLRLIKKNIICNFYFENDRSIPDRSVFQKTQK